MVQAAFMDEVSTTLTGYTYGKVTGQATFDHH